MNSPARWIALALVLVGLLAGVYFWSRNLETPQTGRMAQVDDAPAGSRTQADLPGGADGKAVAIPVNEPGDPLVAGIAEQPDIPHSHAHMGVPSIGERIRDAVEADGTVGDTEVPGINLAGLSQKQRVWFLAEASKLICSCGCGQDLLECRRDDANCPTSPGLVDSLMAVARTH
jgi:hypothetical protein